MASIVVGFDQLGLPFYWRRLTCGCGAYRETAVWLDWLWYMCLLIFNDNQTVPGESPAGQTVGNRVSTVNHLTR